MVSVKGHVLATSAVHPPPPYLKLLAIVDVAESDGAVAHEAVLLNVLKQQLGCGGQGETRGKGVLWAGAARCTAVAPAPATHRCRTGRRHAAAGSGRHQSGEAA